MQPLQVTFFMSLSSVSIVLQLCGTGEVGCCASEPLQGTRHLDIAYGCWLSKLRVHHRPHRLLQLLEAREGVCCALKPLQVAETQHKTRRDMRKRLHQSASLPDRRYDYVYDVGHAGMLPELVWHRRGGWLLRLVALCRETGGSAAEDACLHIDHDTPK